MTDYDSYKPPRVATITLDDVRAPGIPVLSNDQVDVVRAVLSS